MATLRKTVFLTGASSGIGAALAEYLMKEGFEVWGTSRKKERLAKFPALHPIEMSLEDPASVRAAWQQAVSESGGIDIVIQNAGAGLFGAIEDVPLEDARWLWSVLVEGPLLLLQLAAEHLRPRGAGFIIGVSSLAAEMPVCFSAHYSAGKAAFSSLLAGLWMELRPFGVQVIDLRPGDIQTSFNHELPKTISSNSPYFAWAQAAWLENENLMKVAPLTDVIVDSFRGILSKRKNPFLKRVGPFFQARVAPFLSRLIPFQAVLQSTRIYYGLGAIDNKQGGRK